MFSLTGTIQIADIIEQGKFFTYLLRFAHLGDLSQLRHV